MGLHRRSIRLRIFVLILIPLLSLIGLYVFVASITAGNAVDELRVTTLKNDTGEPVGVFEGQVEAERRAAVIYLAAPVSQFLTQLDAQEAKTDQARSAMRAAVTSDATVKNASASELRDIDVVLKDGAQLSALRSRIVSHQISRNQAMNAYNGIIRDCEAMLKVTALQEHDTTIVTQAFALIRIGEAQNVLLQEDALLESDFAAHSFPLADRRQFAQLAGARRALLASAMPDLNARDRSFYLKNLNPQITAELASEEDTAIADTRPGGPPPLSPADWGTDVAAVVGGSSKAGNEAANDLAQRAKPVARSIYLRLILAGGLGLIAVIVSIIVSIWIGRDLVRQLAELRKSALTLAGERLPRVVARLRAGEDVDVSAEAPPLKSSADEIGQVTQAFNTVHRTAVEATVDQARLRRGISDVFRNLARRSQSLLHRQLTLLDAMERRTGDPDELADLYRLDHLTTRMRRHAEGLIILSGATPGRSWRNPVRLVDVLRAAVAEVEDYTRVNVATRTQAALAGPVVADVIHMIAELVENATVFSPPNTPVRLTGEVVGKGFAVEVEDRGLGMSEEKLIEVNERLATPPEFDLSDSDQLGLFVAGRLAARHGIRISLRSNPYGGTTAIVLIPRDLVVPEEVYNTDHSAVLAGKNAVQPTGRHAARGEAIIADSAPTGSHPYADAAEIAGVPPIGAITAGPDGVGAGIHNGGPANQKLAGLHGGVDSPTPPTGTPAAPAASGPTASATSADTESSQGMSWFHRSDDGVWPEHSAPAPADAVPADRTIAAADLTELGLPRRIRQAHLAPQLRETGPHAVIGADGSSAERSPEQARALMSAIQRGWEAGRSADSPVSSEPPDPGSSDLGSPDPDSPHSSVQHSGSVSSGSLEPSPSESSASPAPSGSENGMERGQVGTGAFTEGAPAEEGSRGEEWRADGSQE
ncbi:MAG: nitrate- and nitrite sensing domain-containing protein [Micromonosporaceae bacterium]